MPAKQEKPALQPYLPLSRAARIVHRAATNLAGADEQTLNHIARMIAARTRVFALDAGIDNYFQLLPDEVLEGRVEGGGSAVTFDDRRPRLQGLAIRHSELGMLIGAIRQAYSGA